MATGFPTLKDFNLFFSEDFIQPEVKEEFKVMYEDIAVGGMKMIDFLNTTVVGTTLLGYNLPVTKEQIIRKGDSRTYQGSLNRNRTKEKYLNVTFSLRENMLNYMILYRNIEIFNEKLRTKVSEGGSDDIFFPPIFIFIHSNDGNLMFVWEYQEIQLPEIPNLDLRKDDRGGNNKDFTVKIQYNNVKFHNKLPNSKYLSGIADQYKHNFE